MRGMIKLENCDRTISDKIKRLRIKWIVKKQKKGLSEKYDLII